MSEVELLSKEDGARAAAQVEVARRRPWASWLVGAVASLSVAALFFGVFALGLSGLQEQRSQAQLYASFRGLIDPSSPVAPSIGGSIPQGTPVALISAPVAGMSNVVVVEGTSPADLLDGPGHLPDSPLPGQVGESILMGRSVTAGAPFELVTRLRKGDAITVTTGQGVFAYLVEGHRVAGQALPTIPPSGSLLTLVTSDGTGWLGSLEPSKLVYIDAVLEGKVAPTPPGRPATVSADQIQGASDAGARLGVALWLATYLLACVALAWLARRWGMPRTWLLGVPLVIAILWGLSTDSMRLLPNVF